MLLKQSLAVDTTKLKDGLDFIAHDITCLKEYLRANPTSLYATPQLINQEEPKSIIVLRMKQKKKQILMTMINPVILNIKDTIAVEETQDQITGTYLNIRHPSLQIAYLGLPGAKPLQITLTGKSALVFQQALRLTQGISIDMFGLRIDDYPEYKNGTEEERQEIIANYIQALKEIQKESLTDKDTEEYVKATEFMSENAEANINSEITEQLKEAFVEEQQTQEANKETAAEEVSTVSVSETN